MMNLPMPRMTERAPLKSLRRTVVTMASVCLSTALWSQTVLAQTQPQRLPTLPLSAGMHIIKAELALTPEQHQIGLMHRTSMGTNEGMLFVFDRPGQQCFWMKNTLIPLQIAFLADDGTVVNLAEMKPKSLDSHCSTRPVRFVLEMNTNWFTKRGIQAGSQIRGEPFGTPR
jgi:uncharacterized membrane protein (UPF0127 family)